MKDVGSCSAFGGITFDHALKRFLALRRRQHSNGSAAAAARDLGAEQRARSALLTDKLDEKNKRHLQTICDSSETMGRMIADLLTFSRIGRAELHKVRFSLNDTLKDVLRDMHSQMQNRKIKPS